MKQYQSNWEESDTAQERIYCKASDIKSNKKKIIKYTVHRLYELDYTEKDCIEITQVFIVLLYSTAIKLDNKKHFQLQSCSSLDVVCVECISAYWLPCGEINIDLVKINTIF